MCKALSASGSTSSYIVRKFDWNLSCVNHASYNCRSLKSIVYVIRYSGCFVAMFVIFGRKCKVISEVCIKEVKSGRLAYFIMLALRKL